MSTIGEEKLNILEECLLQRGENMGDGSMLSVSSSVDINSPLSVHSLPSSILMLSLLCQSYSGKIEIFL